VKITSYNITDVGYHYIGLRVLSGLPPTARREEQINTIARGVIKYVSDKALRLMLKEPKGTFETVGEKICQELVHFQFARLVRGAYELTEAGRKLIDLLDKRNFTELRRLMVTIHLKTYDNLRAVVQRHIDLGGIWRPIVEASQLSDKNYLERLLEPTFKNEAALVAMEVLENLIGKTPKKIEDALQERVLKSAFFDLSISLPLFRSLCDRLVSLRLINIMRANHMGCEFAKSYSPCVSRSPKYEWYTLLNILLSSGGTYKIYFCEPDMADKSNQKELLKTIDEAFLELSPQAGYYDLPEVRDWVCERLRIPEAAFDEGINHILDLHPSPLTVGLRYEGITGRRKPLARGKESIQIYNLIRRA
jgi:hypothetical protein